MSKFQILRKYRKELTDIAVLMVIGTISITWFRGDFLLKCPDSFFGFNPSYRLYMDMYIWNHTSSTGVPAPDISGLPHRIFLYSLYEILGLSLSTSQKVVIYVLFTLSGISMYYLTLCLDLKRINRLVSAVFYMMNPYSLSVIWWRQLFWEYAYFLFPLLFGLFIKGLNSKENYFRYVFLICISIVVFSPGLNVSQIPLWIFAILMYLLFYVIKKKVNLIHAFKFTIVSGISSFLVSAWWLLPYIGYLSEEYGQYMGGEDPTETLFYVSKFTTIQRTIRLMGYHAIYYRWRTDYYYNWVSTFSTPLFISIGFLIPIVAFSSLFFKPKNKEVIFFAVLSIIGLFLMKGTATPLGQINLWILKLPFGGGLRHPYDKVGIITTMSYAVLIGYSLDRLYNFKFTLMLKKVQRLTNFTKVLTIVLIVLLLGVYAYPFWNGDVIYSGGQYASSTRVQIPAYYYEASKWIRNQEDEYKIFVLPTPKSGAAYEWKYGVQPNMDPIDRHFFPGHPILQSTCGQKYADRISIQLHQLADEKSDSFGKVIGVANVKYIILHNDWNPDFPSKTLPPEYYKEFLETQKGLKFEKEFGELIFYKVDHYLPFIYAAEKEIYIKSNFKIDYIIDELKAKGINLDSNPVFFFTLENQDLSQYIYRNGRILDNTHLKIQFKKVSPTKYIVNIRNASAPFFLVFEESYDDNWIAKMDGEDQSINNNHFVANGFANSWYIKKIGNFSITLEYSPQQYYFDSAIITFITFLFIAVLALYPNSLNKIKKILLKIIFLNKKVQTYERHE